MAGHVTGRVTVRPVRLGMVFEPSLDVVNVAVGHATSLWGGLYQPFLDPRDLDRLSWAAAGLGVDVLWALDEKPASAQAAELAGYRWRGRGEWGPLAPPKDYLSSRLLGPGPLFEDAGHEGWKLPSWAADDPLAALFTVWFGSYEIFGYGSVMESQFAALADETYLDLGEALPVDTASWITPIVASATAIEYTGLSPGAGFIVIDPASAADLTAFWDMRAYGANVFPVPVGHEERVLPAAHQWLQQFRRVVFRKGRAGDERPLDRRIWVWTARDALQPPTQLQTLLTEAGVEPMIGGVEVMRGWSGDHPLTTNFSRTFTQPLRQGNRTVDVPVPRLGRLTEPRQPLRGGVIAIQVEISSADGVRPDWTFSAPNVRTLAPFLAEYHDLTSQFHRPAADGRVLAAPVGAETVSVSAVPSLAIFDKLIEAPGWKARQTEGGVFMSRLIERMGGADSTIANQPGIRAGLLEAARSREGRTSGAIVQRIKDYQGAWPGPFGPAGRTANYPAEAFRYLLARGILRPALPIACPHCTTKTPVRPEDLTTQMKCEMCLEDFPLGLALGMSPNGRNDWLYQLAGHVGESRLSETLPVMAALHVLTTYRYRTSATVPCVLGWKVEGPDVNCEVDIAAILDDGGLPVVVVGLRYSALMGG